MLIKDNSTKSHDCRSWERVGNMTVEKGAGKKRAREIKVKVNPALNLIEDRCLTMSGSGFWRKNL